MEISRPSPLLSLSPLGGHRYEIKDGDVCFFKFNAPKDGGKKKKDKDDKK